MMWGRSWVILVGLAVAGCAAPAPSTSQPAPNHSLKRGHPAAPEAVVAPARVDAPGEAPITNTDPCATRLHDLCGPLLLYFAQTRALPARIEDLANIPGFEIPDPACPVSNKRYIYNPAGPTGHEVGSHVIIYDAAPSHGGKRWGISVKEPASAGDPLIAKVVVVPDPAFSAPAPR